MKVEQNLDRAQDQRNLSQKMLPLRSRLMMKSPNSFQRNIGKEGIVYMIDFQQLSIEYIYMIILCICLIYVLFTF